MCYEIWPKRLFFISRKSLLKVVGTQGVWLGYHSCGIYVYVRDIMLDELMGKRNTIAELNSFGWILPILVSLSKLWTNIMAKPKHGSVGSALGKKYAPLVEAACRFKIQFRMLETHNDGASTHGRENSWWLNLGYGTKISSWQRRGGYEDIGLRPSHEHMGALQLYKDLRANTFGQYHDFFSVTVGGKTPSSESTSWRSSQKPMDSVWSLEMWPQLPKVWNP